MTFLSRIMLTAALFAGLLAAPPCVWAADLAGNWKLRDASGQTLALLQFEQQNGKPTAKTVAAPLLGGQANLENLRVDGPSLSFSIKNERVTLAVSLTAPKGVQKPERLTGAIEFGGRHIPAELERTEDKELSPADAQRQGPGAEALGKAFGLRDPKQQAAAMKEVAEKYPDSPVAFVASQLWLRERAKEGVSEDEINAATKDFLRLAAGFGPGVERDAQRIVTEVQVANLKAIAQTLRKAGKAQEVQAVAARLEKLEDQLDAAFRQTAIPFKPEPYAGRKGKSNRVAVVELFTGAQCPPCVAADVAFDAALGSYAPADAVFLEYHLHIPGPDPLTNPDSEGRSRYYAEAVRGTPTVFVNGNATEPLGGPQQRGKESHALLRKVLDEALETESQGALKLNVRRQGDQLDLVAEVSELKKTGEKVRLRFVLVEDIVRYAGRNGQRLHHHVVRHFPGGVDGFPLKQASAKHSASVSLADVAKALNDYLAKPAPQGPYLDDDRPLNLKHLKVVAVVQDDRSKEILHAAQADVPEEK
jgi:hypothetical protein